MRVESVIKAIRTQLGNKCARQRMFGFFATGEMAFNDFVHEFEGDFFFPEFGREPSQLGSSAGITVRVVVAGSRGQNATQFAGLVNATSGPGVLEAGRDDSRRPNTFLDIMGLHVCQHGLALFQGEDGVAVEGSDHPLELPHEVGTTVVEVGGETVGVGIVFGETPREGGDLGVCVTGACGGTGQPDASLVFQFLVAEFLR